MNSIVILIVMIFFSYVLINLLLQYGLSKKHPLLNHQPTVSILIAARNEEKYLSTCLDSITRLKYPSTLMEVLILDDHSTDATSDIARAFAEHHQNFKLINIQTTLADLRGKMNALTRGIEQSSGEIILITDADCRVPPSWVDEFVKYFTAEVGLSGSMTLLSSAKTPSTILSSLQNLDWIFLQGIAGGTTALNLPVSVLGNNFGFRRQAYNDAGGFQSIGFSLVEDMELMRAIQNKGWRIAYPLRLSTTVESEPVLSLKEFYRQRLRWVKGGSKTSAWGYLLMSASFLAHLGILMPFLTDFVNPVIISGMCSVLLADFIFLFRLLKQFRLKKLMIYFPLFELFYLLYTIFFALIFFIPVKVIWKERSF